MYRTVPRSLQWYNELVKCLKAAGLTQRMVNPCIFYLKLCWKDRFGVHGAFWKVSQNGTTPAVPGTCFQMNDREVNKDRECKSMVGHILYFVKNDFPFCTNVYHWLSHHLNSSGKSHQFVVILLLSFLMNDLENQKLKMRPSMELCVQDVVDNSFADSP